MGRGAKLLAAMSADPKRDWTIADTKVVAAACRITCKAARRGAHYTFSHKGVEGHLTIPERRPVKPIYIKLLIEMIEGVADE